MNKLKVVPPVSISMTVGERKVEETNIHEQLQISSDNINDHIGSVSAWIAWWGVLYAETYKALLYAKKDYDTWLAGVKSEVSKKNKFTSEKAKEEAVLNSMAEEAAIKFKNVVDAEYNLELVNAIRKAYECKKDMLISYSANLRSEMARDTLIKEWNAGLKNDGGGH